jgi:phosphate transport system permease protein
MVGQPQTVGYSDAQVASDLARQFKKTRNARLWMDRLAVYLLSLCAILVLLPLFSILGDLITQGFSALNLDFFTKLPKPVGEPGGGMANAIVGTLILLGIALCVGVPIGLGTGIYLNEYANSRFAYAIRFITDVMNGIPSIVYGIFAYTLFVVPLKSFSAFSGGAALGIMMIPIVTRTTEDFTRMVPNTLREAGLALGAPRWRVITDIVLPTAGGGIITGIMVALARVAGETAPLLFTAFGNRFWHSSLTEPIAALPLQIFAYAISPFNDWHRQAWAGALVLIFIVFVVNILSSYFVERQSKILSPKK